MASDDLDGAATPSNSVRGWVPRLVDPAEPLPPDASDAVLLDVVEQFQRLRGELDVRRAAVIALLTTRSRPSDETVSVIDEIAAITCSTHAAAGRLWTTSAMLADGLEATRTALSEGAVPWSHGEVVATASSQVPAARVEAFERAALQQVEGVSIGRARDRVRRLVETVDPGGMAERHRRERAQRHVAIEPAADGMAWLTLYLTAPDAVAIHDRIGRAAVIAHGQPGESRHLGELRAAIAADLLLSDLPWIPDDEVEQVGRRVATAVRIVPQVHVTVPALTLLARGDEPATIEGHGPIDADTARALAAAAPGWFRVLTHPETGVVLSVGRKHYKVPKPLRRWLRLRDEVCRFPGCVIPASRCDIDHVEPWHRGGGTDAVNLAHLCRRHHQQKDRGWDVRSDGDGLLHWTSPFGRRRTTAPARTMQQYDVAA